MMATIRRLFGLVERIGDDEESRHADEVRRQVASLLEDITDQTQRAQRRGWHGGRPDPGPG